MVILADEKGNRNAQHEQHSQSIYRGLKPYSLGST